MVANSELFSGAGADPSFLAVRDEPELAFVRQRCELLWQGHRLHAAKDFTSEFSKNFDDRFWEMYLRERLAQHYPDVRHPKSGPDFIVDGPPRVAIEATVASKGTGPSAVPTMARVDDDAANALDDDAESSVPFEQCALRITAALSAKADDNDARAEATKGPYVLAINLPFPEAWLCGVPSQAAVATLGMGGVLLDLTAGTQFAASQPVLVKEKAGGEKALISATAFCSPLYEHISAMVLASVNPFSSAYSNPAIEVLHNPFAKKPLPRGWIPFGTEYWVQGNRLMWQPRD